MSNVKVYLQREEARVCGRLEAPRGEPCLSIAGDAQFSNAAHAANNSASAVGRRDLSPSR